MDNGKGSFWTSLGGVLTAVAGVLTAGAAVAALVIGTGGDKDKESSAASPGPSGSATPAPKKVTLSEWAKQANQICEDTYDDIRALGVGADSNSQFQAIPQTTRIATRGNARLQALDKPPDAETKINDLIATASRVSVAARSYYEAARAGDTATAQTKFAEYRESADELARLDGELGANVCAQGP